jgi:2,3-dihydroxybenzoate-AMP ligase
MNSVFLASSLGVVPYPAQFVARYRRAGLWRDETIPQALRRTAQTRPEALAVVTDCERWTYRDLVERADNIAAGLLAVGLQAGDAVLLQITNTAHSISAFYGMLRAGIRPVCTLAIHRRHEMATIAELTGAVAHLVQADLHNFDLVDFSTQLRAEHPRVRTLLTIGAAPDGGPGVRIEDLEIRSRSQADIARLDDVEKSTDLTAPAVLQLSGGTTGTPKLIPRLHPEYWYNGAATASRWNLTPADRLAFALPIVHNAGIVNALFASHSVGAALVLSVPAAHKLLPLMAAEHATWLMSPPGVMRDYLDDERFDAAFAQVRTCALTAAPVPRPLFDELEGRGVHTVQAFGMTEGLFLFTPHDASPDVRASSVGVPISEHDEVRLLEPESEREVAPGHIGELAVRGPYTIRGYLADPQRNKQTFTADGFYRSGDLAVFTEIDHTATYVISGRTKDLINRGGEKINAEEIETLLMGHDAIAEAALVAMPDDRLGEKAAAFVALADTHHSLTLSEMCAFLADRGVAKFKWPEHLVLVKALPRTEIGKVKKRQLRDQLMLDAGGQAGTLLP